MVVTAVTTIISNVKASYAALSYLCDNDNLSCLIHNYNNKISLRCPTGEFVITELFRRGHTDTRDHAYPPEDFTIGQAGTASSVSTTSAQRARV